MVLEKVYRSVMEGRKLSEIREGGLDEASSDVRNAVRTYIFFRARNEKLAGRGRGTKTAVLAERLGYTGGHHANSKLFLMQHAPQEFGEALLNTEKLKEIGESLSNGKLHPLLAEHNEWYKKHWRIVTALAIAAHEGSFKNSETNAFRYLLRKHGRGVLEGLNMDHRVHSIARGRVPFELKKKLTRPLTAEQREFIKEFGATETDAEIARALGLPEKKVFYARAHMRIPNISEKLQREKTIEAVREIIESSGGRISDEGVRKTLNDMNIEVARRTINKYRRLLQKQRS